MTSTFYYKSANRLKLTFFVCLTFLAFGCQKEDSDSSETSGGGGGGGTSTVSLPSGDMDASINGSDFQSDEARARYRSTDEFTIKASSSNGDDILIVLEAFAGEANYNLSGSSNYGRVLRVVDGNVQHFSTTFGGSGSLIIDDYNSGTNEVSGSFSFDAEMSSSSASLTVENGSFNNVPIIELGITDIPQGQVAYYTFDNFKTSSETQAQSTGHFKLNMEIEHETFPTLRFFNGLNFLSLPEASTEDSYSAEVSYGGASFDYSECNFHLDEYNDSDKTISGRLEVSTSDIEIIFNKIPVEIPETTAEGTINFYSGSEYIEFNQVAIIYYEFEPNETNYREIEATNSEGNRIYIKATYPWYDVGNPAAWENHRWGYDAYLEYYEDENSSTPTQTIQGNFELFSTDNPGTSHIGFESDDLTQHAIGLEIEHD
jgi:hypothetical protein